MRHAWLALCALLALPAHALTTVGPAEHDGTVCCLAADAVTGASYYGQLFTAKTSRPYDLRVWFTAVSGTLRYRLLITEVAGDTVTEPAGGGYPVQFSPTTVIYTGPLRTRYTAGEALFNLRYVPRLVAGRRYAFIIDVHAGMDNLPDVTEMSGGPSAYAGGFMFWLPNPVSPDLADNLGRPWLGFQSPPGVDLDFRMRFR